jgi:8-oxo-dGTP diphosphatase
MNRLPKYCSQCRGVLLFQNYEGRQRPICSECGRVVYLNPVPSVAAILTKDGSVLLVKRNIEPGLGRWGLPGGFIEAGESPKDAAIREVFEETGLHCQPLEVLDACSVLKGYYGDLIVLCYTAEIIDGTLSAGDDADTVEFFEFENLPRLAFRNHVQFLEKFIGRKIIPASYAKTDSK